jgi:hypothetical protein
MSVLRFKLPQSVGRCAIKYKHQSHGLKRKAQPSSDFSDQVVSFLGLCYMLQLPPHLQFPGLPAGTHPELQA